MFDKTEEQTVFAIQSITKSDEHYQRWFDHQMYHRDHKYKSIIIFNKD